LAEDRSIERDESVPMTTQTKLALVSALMAVATASCTKPEETRTAKPVAETERPRRSAIAFVRCLEQTGGQCVQPHDGLYGWDSFSLLGWLASGNPPGILRSLGTQLREHSDTVLIQRRFVAWMNDLREPLRGAECQPAAITPLKDLLPSLRTAAETRLSNLGLWNADFQGVVGTLSEEASEALSAGYLVEMTCLSSPYGFYVATADEDGIQVAVGMLSALPSFLGGEPPGRQQVEGRLSGVTPIANANDKIVSPWIPVSLEEL
jgi:hypothetical protein